MDMDLARKHWSMPVKVQDAQALGYCVRGLRRAWNSNGKEINGVTFEQAIHQGVTLGWLIETGNPYTLRLAEFVLEKATRG